MEINFGYGNTTQPVQIPQDNLIASLKSNPIEHKRKDVVAIKHALNNPIESKKLCQFNLTNKNIVIVTSDITRPLPSYKILPSVLDELYKAGASPSNIKVVLALGSHRQHTNKEKIQLLGKRCCDEVKVIDSDINNCMHLGHTKNGTPIDFDENVVKADFRICIGNVEFHYFAGYSGGYKALMPGVSTPMAIQKNHSLMIDNNACAGNMIDNPVRDDINEAGKKLGIDFLINVVLDEHKNIVYASCGQVEAAHKKACEYLDKMYRCPIKQKADIVIVSQGGAPKDANLYQTQKALDNAKHAIKPGGTIILIGECCEGLGSKKFEEWLTSANKSSDLIKRVKDNFELGGHKAAAIAMILQYAEIYLVSTMEPSFVKSIFLKPKDSPQKAFDDAIRKHGADAKIIAMPFGGSTLPILEQ